MKHRMSRAIDAVELKISIAYSNILEDGKSLDQIIDEQPTIEPQQMWIPCSERLPEEDHWLGGSGKQFSDNVLISIVNRDDEDAWVQVSQTIAGTWALELPRYCKVIAWMPLPEPYAERGTDD